VWYFLAGAGDKNWGRLDAEGHTSKMRAEMQKPRSHERGLNIQRVAGSAPAVVLRPTTSRR
jgi:hypothetical protein